MITYLQKYEVIVELPYWQDDFVKNLMYCCLRNRPSTTRNLQCSLTRGLIAHHIVMSPILLCPVKIIFFHSTLLFFIAKINLASASLKPEIRASLKIMLPISLDDKTRMTQTQMRLFSYMTRKAERDNSKIY